MPAVQYPFIDIAVHERVRDRFGRGEALVLFSIDLEHVLWANGRGASLFGTNSIYDFLDHGPKPQDITFRQISMAASKLSELGDSQFFTARIAAGFRTVPVKAIVELINIDANTQAILFSSPVDVQQPSAQECAKRMIEGFSDPDIHLAVLDENGLILAASDNFRNLDITPNTVKTLTTMTQHQAGHLIKRPIPTGKGYLPAATGQLSQAPVMNLLFVVETAIGTLDPVYDDSNKEEVAPAAPVAAVEVTAPVVEPAETKFETLIDDIASIEDLPQQDEEFDASEALDAQASLIFADVEEPEHAPVEAEAEAEAEAEENVAVVEDEVQLLAAENYDERSEDLDFPVFDDIEPSAAASASVEQVSETDVVADEIEDAEEAPSAAPGAFVFNPSARASRFVWKIDANGCFSSISHEFAEAVGPRSAAVEGMSFADVASLLNLDTDGKITELLSKRDTWSGKTIFWPVEGTSLSVPIDLAALPTYTRTREFDGFRGFGIVRLADAVEDPQAIGLSLADNDTVSALDMPVADLTPEADVEPEVLEQDAETDEHVFEDSLPDAELTEEATANSVEGNEPPVSFQPPREEVPALRISETPNRRFSDKIIQLEEHRSRGRDGLTPGEQAAFREIARQLTPKGEEVAAEVSEPAPVQQELETETPVVSMVDPVEETQVETVTHDREEPEVIEETPDIADVEASAAVEATQQEEVAPSRETGTLTEETVDALPLALLVHTGDDLIHANPDFLRLTGYSSVEELASVGGIDALLQRQDLENIGEGSGGMVAVSAENDLIPVNARLQSIRWHGSAALMLSLVPVHKVVEPAPVTPVAEVIDAPANNLAVETLQGEVDELHSILETATDGIVILDEEGTIRSLNRSASALFNYDNGEISGKPFVVLFAHESQKAVLDYLSGLSNNGVASVLNDGRDVIGREASGGFLPLFMTIGRLKSSRGFCAVIRDITQWKRTEEELRNAKRVAETANAHKTDFLARVSHEIRTPLNAIIGFADMMATERFGPIGHPRYVEYANDIGRSGRHVLDIVNDLLDISKIEAGQMDLDFVAVELNDTISEAVSLVQPQANNQRVIIRTSLSQSVPAIVADLRSIKQIVLNILSNAIRFTPAGGQIVVSTAYEPNGSVNLRIRDTGIGMSRTELEQAMKPFRQVASSNRIRGDGTGLGLPLTKAMVDANRANFSINSSPNEGTLVEINFPSQRVLAN
ncbi:ATP-binding protein [Agrobacterium sp.]|uniref:ATP-binding protein n=1 Tax=Agrobacterium sp. TaxID=361 RepID=UPI0028AC213C|nr:ATP-binding protein [Agrobacterium sp.]